MLSLQHCGFTLLFLSILTGVSCDELTPVNNEESSLEGSTVTLSYTYYKLSTTDYFYWYRQYPGKPPQFIISHLGSGGILNSQISRLTIKVENKEINMSISSAAVTDSAVYYCALHAGGGLKITFGSGTRLSVEPNEEYKPSYYELSKGNTSVCLATGFSRHKATVSEHGSFFNETKAVRISDDSLYNQVAFISSPEEKEICLQAAGQSDKCEDKLEQDAEVNLMTVTVLGLRLLFVKTVVFNVLLTLRLWISQCEYEPHHSEAVGSSVSSDQTAVSSGR